MLTLEHHITRPSLKYSPPRARRKGQALLLAVLILIFAALLGTTFIAVVAINIGQTSRNEERDKARVAAQAGLDFANAQLTYGLTATRWQPSDVNNGGNVPPASTTDPTYYTYWTPFDEAQGWNTAGFVKFPDPRSTNQNLSAPNYMLKIERVNSGDSDNADNTKTGMIRITSIGLSSDDPNSFYTLTAYKAGPAQSPLTAAMRSVSNWNFEDGGLPAAEACTADPVYCPTAPSSGTTLTLKNVEAAFPSGSFFVLIGNPGGTLRSAFVTSATASALTFAASQTWANGERVEIAANLGAPLAVDYNKDGTADTTVEKVNLEISDTSAATPGSTQVNGGLIVSGNTLFHNLRDPQQASAIAPLGQVRASGLIQIADAGLAKVQGTYNNGTSSGQQNLVSSTDPNFPYSGGGTLGLGLVTDGANRISKSVDSTRQTQPFTPPDITAGSGGLDRYRLLTKYSADASFDALGDGVADQPHSGAYGYGEGVYINNPQDKERVYDATRLREMTAAELRDLLFNNASDTSKQYLRMSVPSLKTDALRSLEEQHLRGWVSPTEFRARGAMIELDPDNARIIVTRESITDGRDALPTPDATPLYNNEGPVPSMGWRTTTGDLAGDTTYGGVYRQTLPWPANGVIFAEGNVRVRGTASNSAIDPGRSLTIVSMNNIYIEGSLNAGARKVLLLARKNVVMNPTRVIGSVDEQTRIKVATSASGTTIAVTDADNFRVGDCIEIKTTNNQPQRIITNIDTTNDILTVAPALSATSYPIGKVIQSVRDPWFNNNQPYTQNAIRITKFSDMVQRRLYLSPGTSQVRLAFRHNAERKDALTVSAVGPTVTPFSPTLDTAEMENKLAAVPRRSVIEGNEKSLKVIFDEDPDATGTDIFPDATPGPPPADQATAIGIRLEDMAAHMTNRHPTTQWNYTATVNSNYNAGTGTRRPLFYFLAGVGNRFDWGNTTALPADPTSRKNIKDTTYAIPMATSVWAMMNGNIATIRSFDPVLSSNVDLTQFGFNPDYDGTTAVTAREDVLTSDQGFYQSGAGSPTSTSYSIMQTVDNSNYSLDGRQLVYTRPGNLPNDGVDTLALRLNNSIVSGTSPPKTVEEYFDATPPPANADIPFYRFSRLKVEQIVDSNDANRITSLSPGYTFNIQAYVYAQQGSWYVIPGANFDSKVKSNYYDLDGDNTQDAGESLDLNRDGEITRDETIANHRYARYNYSINFTGAIMEKQTAFVGDPDGAGSLVGEVSDWTDKWATTQVDFSTGSQVNTYGTVKYMFDAAAALDAVDSDITNANIVGWRPPVTPDLIYQSG